MQRFSNRIRFFCFPHLSAKAALPGRLLSCAGGGGDADRAFAQLEPETGNFRVRFSRQSFSMSSARLSIQYDGFGGLVVGEVGNSVVVV